MGYMCRVRDHSLTMTTQLTDLTQKQLIDLLNTTLNTLQNVARVTGISRTTKMLIDASTQTLNSILSIGLVKLTMKQTMVILMSISDQLRTLLDLILPVAQNSFQFVFQNVVVVFGAVLLTMNQLFEWVDDQFTTPIADVFLGLNKVIWENSNATFNFIRATTIKAGVIVDAWFGVENWAMWGIGLGRNVDNIVTGGMVEAWSVTPAVKISRTVDIAVTNGIVNAHLMQGYQDFQQAKQGGAPSSPGFLAGQNPLGDGYYIPILQDKQESSRRASRK